MDGKTMPEHLLSQKASGDANVRLHLLSPGSCAQGALRNIFCDT
jgi:hypothetical protein